MSLIEPQAEYKRPVVGSAAAHAEAAKPGWPAETTDGRKVLIVKKEPTVAGDILTDTDGCRYRALTTTTTIEPID